MGLNVRKGDNVLVIAGKDKGKSGKVLAADPKNNRVIVDKVNIVTKHVKPRSAQATGGIQKDNGFIDVSNVQIICPVCGKATRVANKEVDGKKVRTCVKCGATLEFKAEKPEKKERRKSAKAKAKSTDVAETEVKAEKVKEVQATEVPVKKTRKSTKKTEKSAE